MTVRWIDEEEQGGQVGQFRAFQPIIPTSAVSYRPTGPNVDPKAVKRWFSIFFSKKSLGSNLPPVPIPLGLPDPQFPRFMNAYEVRDYIYKVLGNLCPVQEINAILQSCSAGQWCIRQHCENATTSGVGTQFIAEIFLHSSPTGPGQAVYWDSKYNKWQFGPASVSGLEDAPTTVTGVRWLGTLGDLGRPKNVHARTVLAAWNKSQNYIMAGYPNLDDILQENWTYRDRRMLGSFVIWWNNTANPPLMNWGQLTLPPPTYFHGVQDSDLTEQHLAALDTWATKSGSGLPTCIEACFSTAIGAPTQDQMQACLNQCALGAKPPGGGTPSGGPGSGNKTCPPGMIWDEPTQGCVQPPATGPLPPAPPPIPAPTTASSTGTSSGVGLLIGGAIVLAAVAIFAATVSGGTPTAKSNPRRRRVPRRSRPRLRKLYSRGPERRRAAANPEEAPIANPCDAPGLLYGDRQTLFYWSLGAYGDTHVYVWADSYESAEEEMLEWVDDNTPGLLSTVGEEDYKNAAEELGVDWDPSEPDDEVIQKAEADMIMVSHTTLEHGNAIPSWEVHVNEVRGKKREAIKRLSQIYCEDEGPLPLPSGG